MVFYRHNVSLKLTTELKRDEFIAFIIIYLTIRYIERREADM